MFITVVDTIELLIVIVLTTFVPKIIANQFAQTDSWSSILTGTVGYDHSPLTTRYAYETELHV